METFLGLYLWEKQIKHKFKILLFSFYSLSIFCEENSLNIGSDFFRGISAGGIPWSNAVEFARSPEANSNSYYSRYGYVTHLRNTPSVYGPGQRHVEAARENVTANYYMAAAQTEPRHISFLNESLAPAIRNNSFPITDRSGDLDPDTNLNDLQYGDPANRYLEALSIEPELGYYQTADNEQAFQATYDNILLGRAEEALFKGDANSAKEYFNAQITNYKNESDKQQSAAHYQKDGLVRSQETAATFRDFYKFKSQISQQNLALMPTEESLLNNCHQNNNREIDRVGVYHYIMEPVYSDVDFAPPQITVDFCSRYVTREKSYLIKNKPVREKLAQIINDSEKMAQGLDEIEKALGNKNLSIEQISNFLNSNQVWKEFAMRQEAWKKCSEEDSCLKVDEDKIKSMLNYKDGLDGLDESSKFIRSKIATIIETGTLPSDLKIPTRSYRGNRILNNIASNGNINHEKNLALNVSSEQYLNKDKSVSSINSPKGKVSLNGGRFPASKDYKYSFNNSQRDEKGVLRNSSGKVIPGFEAPAHHDLFKIISIRYRKKFYGK